MDDISRDAAISKKTIYKSFEDKNQLVQRLVGDLLLCFKKHLDECKNEAENPIEEVILFSQTPLNLIGKISPTFFFELKKFFPAIWKMIEELNKNVLVPFIAQNIRKGIDADLYRPGIDIPFAANLRLQQITSVFDVKTFADSLVGPTRLVMQLTEFYQHAIATQKGKRLINKYLNVDNERQFSN